MKKRVLSIVCAIAVIAAMLTVGIVSSSAAGTTLAEPIDKNFVVGDWDFVASANLASGHTSSTATGAITAAGKFGSGYDKTFTIVSKAAYDLSTGFVSKSTLTFKNHYTNYFGEYCSMYIGDVAIGLELRVQNVKGVANYNVYIYYGGNQIASYATTEPNGEYAVKYNNGKVSVSKGGTDIEWTVTGGTSTEVEITGADFSETKIGYRVSPNYSKSADTLRNWTGVYLEALAGSSSSEPASSEPASSEPASSEPASSEPASSEPASSEPASSEPASSEPASSEAPVTGAPLTAKIEKEFVKEDWEGSVDNNSAIIADGKLISGQGSVFNVNTKIDYDLSNGFEFKSTLKFKSHYANYYGEYCSMYVGPVETGIEVRIQNVKGSGLYTAKLYYGGEEIATYDLTNAPNGEYMLRYKDGKVTVTLGGAAIKWTLADTSTATDVAISDADFLKNASVGFRIVGNYSGGSNRNWSGFYLAPVSTSNGGNGDNSGAGGVGGTGDARNLVIPAVAIVFGVCTVAFVSVRKRNRA